TSATRGRVRRALSIAAVALTAVSAAGTASAATHRPASSVGRVCLFSAPGEPAPAGHVGWGYRWNDGSDKWDFGATLGQDSGWARNGSTRAMLDTFRTASDAGGYKFYRCVDTGGQNQDAAFRLMKSINGRHYNLAIDNCLTKSIRIFKAYDNSGRLNGLPAGKFTAPNDYFHETLDKAGWDAIHAL
ncbi:hypothetical protein AB0C13_40975, partial [Streptomyces sp. NPDC049099]|uniref:hypothetical protein n=1 Tax=Streptomyces sp. NPDC049099 TaxID=3155768 RepID=UPI00342E0AE5